MSLSNIGFVKVLFFPWMCKTLWAPFVDRHGNKKTWLLWSMLGLGTTCVLAASIQPDWLVPLCVILLAFNFLTSTQDIATDGLAIEILTTSQVASGNIAQVVGYKFGAVIGGGLLAWLSDHISWSPIFIFLTLTYASAMVMVKIFVPESTHSLVERPLQIQATFDSEFQICNKDSDPNKENPGDNGVTLLDSSSVYRSKIEHMSSALHSNTDLKPCLKRDADVSSFKLNATNKQYENTGCEFHSSPHSGSNLAGTNDGGADSGGTCWVKEHFADVLKADGTMWIIVYVLVYKLGEQGALNMMPMFLIDGGMPTAEVGLWTGVVGQAMSISGSVIGGAAIMSGRYTALKFLQLLSVVKVVVLATEAVVVTTASMQTEFLGISTVSCITLMQILMVVSGAVSTAAFTLMMQCSQHASPHCRASHYSLLATAEVLGKLLFSVFVGVITDWLGYSLAFGLFLTLSLIVLPLFHYAPNSLSVSVASLQREGNGCNKNC
ncbi:major facilitator superfamily domain-containing protein 3-like isoform X2 [Babylonia areolata]